MEPRSSTVCWTPTGCSRCSGSENSFYSLTCKIFRIPPGKKYFLCLISHCMWHSCPVTWRYLYIFNFLCVVTSAFTCSGHFLPLQNFENLPNLFWNLTVVILLLSYTFCFMCCVFVVTLYSHTAVRNKKHWKEKKDISSMATTVSAKTLIWGNFAPY